MQNHQNVQTMHFWQKVPGVNGLTNKIHFVLFLFRVEHRMSQNLVRESVKKVSRSCVARDIRELLTTPIDYRVCVAHGKLQRVIESHGILKSPKQHSLLFRHSFA